MTDAKASPAPRMTKQRAAILDVLDGTDEFRSAQAWHDLLRHDGSSVGLATVYRSLQALAETGEVDAIVTSSGETLYRRCGAVNEHHHHLRCRVCGTADDIEVPEFEEWAARIASERGFARMDHTVEITGVCADCTAKGH
ncbi:Fur family transcriptional regulator [Demequina sp. NBRC 110053]|uniref:Fur family transcriptional regulator n=1 Tax=Demequina sp. NBRC 110053 TaxID=1570342 RepID=UPI000A015B6F|nr:Fur family transcriptional regulator [Demequina sp. NBRC 110053]